MAELTALILAGGKSSRMGRDKTLLRLGGQTLLERACAFGQALSAEVLVAGGDPAHFDRLPDGCRAVPDETPGLGPLGGLCAGLAAMESELALVWAADMPFLSAEAALRLRSAIGGADACAYAPDGVPEPLFALYRKSCLAPARAHLARGELRLRALLRAVECVLLAPQDASLFVNLNTPEEFARAQKLVEKHE